MAVSLALADFGPLTIAAGRVTLAALILVGIAYVRGVGLPDAGDATGRLVWLSALSMALTSNAVPFSLLSWAQKSVASGFAGVCMAIVPLFVLPLAHVFVPGERMNLRRLIGFLIGTAGVIVLIGPDAFVSTGAETETIARLACVAAAGCYAIGAIVTRLCPEVEFLALAAATMLLASLCMLPVALIVEGWPANADPVPLLALLYLGVLPTAGAQIILVRVVRQAGPVFLSLVNYQVPIWSVLLGALLLSEPLPASLLSAMTLILTGLALAQYGALRRLFGGQ